MKIAYIYDGGDINNRVLMGIDHKVLSQVATFNHAGYECKLMCPQRKRKYATYLQNLPFFPDRTKWETVFDSLKADIVYIRRPVYISKQLISQLRRLKKRHPNTIILFEVPTWPYDREMLNPHYYMALLKDRVHRKELKGLVDRVVDLSNTPRIFGIPTIQIQNGIDLDTVQCRRPSLNRECIHAIFVALFSNWHGADRLIEGVKEYRDKNKGKATNLVIHFVGEGPEYKNLVNLVSKYNLKDFFVFHGSCTRIQMDEIYDTCTLGIASLGLHRIGLDSASTLKTREYLAKGLPFIYSGVIQEFATDPVDFCLSVPANDTPISIDDTIAFYDEIYAEDEANLIQHIRDYAVNHVGMLQTMKPVIDFIENGE